MPTDWNTEEKSANIARQRLGTLQSSNYLQRRVGRESLYNLKMKARMEENAHKTHSKVD
jgi:hypothetical protein